MQERSEMIDTKELMVAIYSMEVISYRIPFPGKNMEELIKIHKNKKNVIKYIHSDDDYNICFWYNLTYITKPDSKGIQIDRYSRIAEGKRLLFESYNVKKENQREFFKKYQGFNWDDSLKTIIFFFITMMMETSISCILSVLISYQDPNNNSERKMDIHMKEYQYNNGQIKKYITLEKYPKPFVPHITSNKTYRYLLAHNRESEYKATQYYITLRFQTELQKIRGYQFPILVPTAVASTIKANNYIKTISFDKSQDNFVEKWLDQVFCEALQIRDDNKFADDVPQRYEVHVIGFPMTISNQQIYDSLRNEMVGGNSFVIHREKIVGKTQIHKFKQQDQQATSLLKAQPEVISYELPHTVENIICLDFDSFYGFCMSSEQHPLIPFKNHKMSMPGGVKYGLYSCYLW
ncbi:MAG: hypothetical protein EZS28_008664 [Streblomastix strix]|uniref:Uncharacterized protein n=1 Tax=Streblomastix strix TaxID=222440 RepID=A0A5J4WMM1_9EUKA|nr:MAG: hypothetical protein EZS28_008664 [Streblomastix strix]